MSLHTDPTPSDVSTDPLPTDVSANFLPTDNPATPTDAVGTDS